MWGFAEWFYFIWMVCYAITYSIVLYKDNDLDKAVGYMLVCGFFWPILWIKFFSELLTDMRREYAELAKEENKADRQNK